MNEAQREKDPFSDSKQTCATQPPNVSQVLPSQEPPNENWIILVFFTLFIQYSKNTHLYVNMRGKNTFH